MVGAMHFPGDAQLRPEALVRGLATRVRALGGIIEEDCTITGLDRDAGRISAVQTGHGARRARDVVLALGAWSPRLTAPLGVALPIQPGKGYSITYTRPALAPRRPLVLHERSVCVTAWADGFRLGSTMEFSGYDASLNRRRLDALVRAAAEYLHQPEGPQRLEEWYGWRPMTWDDLPIIGRVPGCDNLLLATGHGMLGITMSAATGRMVAEIACGTTPFVDPTPYALQRFG
jgi:D-amino-acid dehydrogenase